MNKAASRTLRIVFTLVIVIALVLFARKVDWAVTWRTIVDANFGVLMLAAAVNLLSLVFKGVRWWIFLRPVGAKSFWMSQKATFAGAGLNNVLVANGGEAARVIFVARAAHVQSAKILATLALERMFELIGYVVMLALAVSFLSLPPSLVKTRPFAWAALVGIAVLLVWLLRRPELVEETAELTVAVGWRQRLSSYFRQLGRTIGGISTGPRFAMALGLSVLIWALQVWTYALTARSAHFNLPLVGTVAALLAVNLGFAVRATPGNVGVFQTVYALTAVGFGMDKDQAIAVAFLIQTQQIIPVTLLGVALAPEFIFHRKRAARAEDEGLELHSRQERASS
jgi:uncharacterized protein (TIRG00374 family)